jgi:signal transduction histidine kinase
MIAAAARLTRRVLTWQAGVSLASAGFVALFAPRLLLLEGEVSFDAMVALFLAIFAGGGLSLAYTFRVLYRHRYLLRTLALGSRSVEAYELRALGDEPWRVTIGWLVPSLTCLALVATLMRPGIVDLTTGVSLALLGAVIVAAASLPLYVVVRSQFLRAIELAPFEVMREVVERVERSKLPQQRVARRMLAAVATPVVFLAVGAALIANSHLRRADERQREETANAVAHAAIEASDDVVEGAGLDAALARAAALGFHARPGGKAARYEIKQSEDGIVDLVVPLDSGSARMRFSGSTIGVLSLQSVAIALVAIVLACLLGAMLGRALSEDLRIATRGVRMLGTDMVLSGTSIARPARFRGVADLQRAIDELAGRFRVFAQAQVRAIESREAATRMRGLFFASVSHDLKSPLNAILGFTALVRQREVITEGQSESLALIERRGRELLALIETILDAARVEAEQLVLVHDSVKIGELFAAAIAKGKDLGGERELEVVSEFAEGVPPAYVDRVRMARALATFIGHAIRTAERETVVVRAVPAEDRRVRIEVEVPSTRFSARQLEAMLDPSRQPGTSPHRGLALALGLARSVVELHRGIVRVEERGAGEAVFVVLLPIEPPQSARRPLRRIKVSTPLARAAVRTPPPPSRPSTPPPPSGPRPALKSRPR